MARQRYFFLLITLFLAASLYWSLSTQIEIATHALGKVVPSGSVRVIQNLEGGIVRQIFVEEGQKIEGGQKILEFEAVASKSEVGELEAHLAFLSIEMRTIRSFLDAEPLEFSEKENAEFGELIISSKNRMEAQETLLQGQIRVFDSEILKKQNDIASNNGIIDEKKLTIKTIDEQIALSAGEKRKLNETRINEKAELIKFFDDQIKLNSVEVAEIFSQKMVNKKRMLSLLDQQIKISEDLLAKQITSELAHLDLLKSRQATATEIKDLEALEKQREIKQLDLLKSRNVAKSDIQSLRAEETDRQFRILELKQRKQALFSEIAEIEKNNDGFNSDIETLKLRANVAEREFEQELTVAFQRYNDEKIKYERRIERFRDELGRRIVTSPIDGVVKKINIFTIGGVVQPGMDLVEIVPSQEKLVVEAQLPIEDIGFVKLDDKVKIRLSGPHGLNYDPMQGVIENISPDAIKSENGEEFYKLRVNVSATSFTGKQGTYQLVPGLTVDCSFVLAQRSLFENIIAPLNTASGKAFSENVWNNKPNRNYWLMHFKEMLS